MTEEELEAIRNDERYQRNVAWGEPRPGHPEGSVRAHIEELEANLEALAPKLTAEEIAKLRVLIHTHDTFKAEANEGVPITHPTSHASLAREFLAEFCADPDLLNAVQFHDEPFALWRQHKAKGACNQERFAALLARIQDWDLYLAFLIIDGCTAGKSREPLRWFLAEVEGKVASRFGVSDLL